MKLCAAAAALAAIVPFLFSQSATPPPGAGEESLPAMPAVGAAAPEFRLNDHQGRAVQVGGAAEHWTALAFYPRAATPG